jgi:hypothetical protein
MSDFNDDGWKMTPSHNVKSVEDFLADTTPAELSENNIFKTDTSLEDSLSDWGIAIPEVITKKEESSSKETRPSSILDHLGTGFISNENPETESIDLKVEESLPSKEDLGYPDENPGYSDEATGEFEYTPEPIREERSLFTELSDADNWSVTEESSGEGELASADSDNRHEDGISLANDSENEIIEVTTVDDPSLPNENDLEYPDLDAIIQDLGATSLDEKNIDSSLESAEEKSELTEIDTSQQDELKSLLDEINEDDLPEDYKPKSKLTSLGELNSELDAFSSQSAGPEEITGEFNRDFNKEIPDNISADDFWAIDEFPSISGKLESSGKETSGNIGSDYFKSALGEEDDSQFKMKPSSKLASINLSDVSSTPAGAPAQNINIDELVEKVKAALEPQLEAVVKKLFAQKIEQVAWEVIPDLAENVIKKEVEEIAKHVYTSTNSTKKE